LPAEISIYVLLILAAILFTVSFVQGAIGFAAGMLGIPLMMMGAGLSLPQAVAVAIVTSGMQNILGGLQLRKDIVWRDVWRPMLIRLVALPLGVFAQAAATKLDPGTVKQMVGVVLLVVLLVQWAVRVEPREHLHVAWEFAAFLCAGFMVGFCGMGGPPMVLWIMAHNWSNRRTRAFMFVVFFSSLIPQALLMVMSEGTSILYYLVSGLLALPFVLLGTFLGVRIGDRISRPRMRMIIYAVLITVAVSAVTWPFISGPSHNPAKNKPVQNQPGESAAVDT